MDGTIHLWVLILFHNLFFNQTLFTHFQSVSIMLILYVTIAALLLVRALPQVASYLTAGVRR